MIKLDVGSGGKAAPYLGEGWLGVDPFVETADVKAPMWELPYPDNSVAAIFSSHALEHVAKAQVPVTLKEWYRVLQPGGVLILRIPDLEWCCKWFLEHPTTGWDMDVIFGNQQHGGEFHKTGFTLRIAMQYLLDAGFLIMKYEELKTHAQKTMSFEALKVVFQPPQPEPNP